LYLWFLEIRGGKEERQEEKGEEGRVVAGGERCCGRVLETAL
jgi:hypothetical protein